MGGGNARGSHHPFFHSAPANQTRASFTTPLVKPVSDSVAIGLYRTGRPWSAPMEMSWQSSIPTATDGTVRLDRSHSRISSPLMDDRRFGVIPHHSGISCPSNASRRTSIESGHRRQVLVMTTSHRLEATSFLRSRSCFWPRLIPDDPALREQARTPSMSRNKRFISFTLHQ